MSLAPPVAAVRASDLPDLDPALALVLNRVRLRARRRTAWLRWLWSLESGAARAPAEAVVDASLEGRDDPEGEANWYAEDPEARILTEKLTEVETAMARDGESRLARLHLTFGLDEAESDLLQACLAEDLDPSLGPVFGTLQDPGHGYVTEELAARLFGHGRARSWSPDGGLHRWELVIQQEVGPTEPRRYICDPHVRRWLEGRSDLDPMLVGSASLHPPLEPLADWDVRGAAKALERTTRDGGARGRLHLIGPTGSGRRTFAAAVAAELGLPLLVIDVDGIDDVLWARTFLRAQRQAYLDACALAWSGKQVLQRAWPRTVPWFPDLFVISVEAEPLPRADGVVDMVFEMPWPSLPERRRLWKEHVAGASRWRRKAFEALVANHPVTVGEIARVGRLGPPKAEDAARLLRERTRERLGNLTERLDCPFDWDDLVVPTRLREALQDFCYEATARAAFWERPEARRQFPNGRGLIGLFSGPPGTGKTMAAQVVAATLGVDLHRIDLSSVVSKYVGESSQNVERILSRAAHTNAVLLFDEADALFGKRTEINDAHDRFANTDTNFLLQAVESYPGIAILATNQKHHIDPAFIRRLRYVLEFPMPDARERLRIWRNLVGALAGPEGLKSVEGQLEAIASTVELTGAQIRFAVLSALFRAARRGKPLAAEHLLDGLDRELTKEGQGVSDRDRRRFLDRA